MTKKELYEYKSKKVSIYALAKKHKISRQVVVSRLFKLALKEF